MKAERVFPLPGSRLSILIILVILSAVFLWLFLYPAEKGEGLTPRLFSAFWNLGHFGLFFIWAWCLSTALAKWVGLYGIKLLLICLLISLAAGYIIEEVQFSGGERSASIDDVILDITGAFVALAFHPQCRWGTTKFFKTALTISAVGMSMYTFFPASRLLADTYWQWRQFPVLLDFSTPLELSRVNGSAEYSLMRREGQNVNTLRVTFSERRSSVFGFADFPSDWRGYKQLEIDIFNPDTYPLKLACRIQDQSHNRWYYDAYNESFTINPGKTKLVIALEKVQESPRDRKLDMSSIDLTLCYTVNLQRKRELWIEKIALTN